jgi:AraC-like DNA-binding protein
MSASQILLVTISGLGVVHGLFLAVFLWTTPKGNPPANRLLGILLTVLSFRVGKSVFLEFLNNLDVKFIFIGLGSMMAIGPLFYLFAKATAEPAFRWKNGYWLHFIPCFLAMLFGFWINQASLKSLPIQLFYGLYLSYYSHYLIYLIITKSYILRQRKVGLPHKADKLLSLLFYGLMVIWVAYVFNLFDESIPYIIGPALYSVVAYVTSFIIITKGYLPELAPEKYKTTRVSEEQMEQLFSRVKTLVIEEKQYKNPELTLKSLSKTLKVSPQVLSMVINQMSRQNFNAFINHYRVDEATRLLQNPESNNLTIAAIADEVGFNSISSFNRAFKKQTGKTPQNYRQHLV